MVTNMQAISDLMSDKRLEETVAKLKKEYLAHPDIKQFIWVNEGVLTEESIDRSLSRIGEYITMLKDPWHKPKLVIYNGLIDVVYEPRDTALATKQAKGIRTSLVLDETTSQFRGLSLADIKPDFSNTKALAFMKEFMDNYAFGRGNQGMWLCGSRGVGKSYLMGGFAGELTKCNIGVTYVGVATMLSDLMGAISKYSEDKKRLLERYQKSEVLILDDMGTEYLTRWTFQELLYPIINYRQNNKLPIFFTSNYTKYDYYQWLAQQKDLSLDDARRLQARVDNMAAEVQMTGADRRAKAKF